MISQNSLEIGLFCWIPMMFKCRSLCHVQGFSAWLCFQFQSCYQNEWVLPPGFLAVPLNAGIIVKILLATPLAILRPVEIFKINYFLGLCLSSLYIGLASAYYFFISETQKHEKTKQTNLVVVYSRLQRQFGNLLLYYIHICVLDGYTLYSSSLH